MEWKKLGNVYVASGMHGWDRSHAYIPTPLILDDRVRVYVAFWDRTNVGRIGYVDLAIDDLTKVLQVSNRPILDIGRRGAFDDNGVSPVSIVKEGGTIFLYYIGWQTGTKVRYFLFSGLAKSIDGGNTFTRVSEVPVLDRNDNGLFFRTAPFVVRDGGIYKMWYVSGSKWITVKGKEVPTYGLRYMQSKNPHKWEGGGIEVLNPLGINEYGFGRPWVLKEEGIYKMWYSIRAIGEGYRIGYAESVDGLNWVRKDSDAGITVSKKGWDSQMICFSAIFDIGADRFMLYNGNNFGETGFGLAKQKK